VCSIQRPATSRSAAFSAMWAPNDTTKQHTAQNRL
jgi:hypothetical protein